MSTHRLPFLLATLTLLTFAGCRDAKITSYRVRKEAPPKMPAITQETGNVPQLHYKAPTGWTEQPAGAVRIASFTIAGKEDRKADMSVTQFPGDVGGDLANVNRWRGQIQLSPITAADLSKDVREQDFPAGQFSLVDMVSDKPVIDGKYRSRILGAWLKQPDRTWFFKLSGEADLVAAQQSAFEEFLKSITITAPAPSDALVGEISGSSGVSTTSGVTPPNAAGAPGAHTVTWSAPNAWTTKPLGTMRKGSFTVHGKNGAEADLSVISFPGDAGGVAENLNRWRGQLQLETQDATTLAAASSTIANDNLRFTVVDYTGTTGNGPTRLLGAILPLDSETYFFKLMGPESAVGENKQAFLDFLKTVQVR
ncbi:MAG TPA: hypothetical protein VIM69_05590 [Opitutaceae bacterium]